MSKIFWTTEERSKLSEEMVKLFKLDLNLARRRALGGAQLVLPQSRRRHVTDQIAFTQRLLIEAARNRARGAVHAEPAPLVCRSPYCECPVGKCVNGLPDMRGEPFAPTPAPQPLQELVKSELGSALEHLIDLVVDRVLARVQSRVVTDKISAAPAVPTYDAAAARANATLRATPSAAERVPRVGVLICGLQPHQARTLMNEFPSLDITCYDSDEARVKAVIRRAHTFLMTRFLSHQVDLRFRGSSPNLHRVVGGYSELRAELEKLAAQGVVKC